jgi:anti-anti-sigma regulatory factor
MSITIKLPAELDINATISLHEQMQQALRTPHNITLDCAAVISISTALVQLLFSIGKTLATTGHTLQLNAASDSIRTDLRTLGASTLLSGENNV